MPTRSKRTSAAAAGGAGSGGDARVAAEATWLSVVGAYQRCDAALGARLAALGLRVPEHEVLVNLLRQPGLTQQALARRCFVAKSGISMLLTRLERRGLVRREADAADARLRRLHLSERGRALAQRSHAVQLALVQAMAGPVTAAELAVVRSVMERVGATLDALASPG